MKTHTARTRRSSVRRYECGTCQRRFYWSHHLERHEKLCQNTEQFPESTTDNSTPTPPPPPVTQTVTPAPVVVTTSSPIGPDINLQSDSDQEVVTNSADNVDQTDVLRIGSTRIRRPIRRHKCDICRKCFFWEHHLKRHNGLCASRSEQLPVANVGLMFGHSTTTDICLPTPPPTPPDGCHEDFRPGDCSDLSVYPTDRSDSKLHFDCNEL